MTIDSSTADVSPEKRKRPFGVNAIIALSTLSVVYGIGALIVLYFDAAEAIPSLASLQVERWLMLYFIVTSVVQVFVVIGLWRLERWGWFLVMLHTGFGMFLNIWAYFYAQPNYIVMAVSVLIVFYMNQREVHQAFLETPVADAPSSGGTQEQPAA